MCDSSRAAPKGAAFLAWGGKGILSFLALLLVENKLKSDDLFEGGEMLIAINISESAKISKSSVSGIKQRSAMNPLLWILGVSIPGFILAAHNFKEDRLVMWFFLVAIGLTTAVVLGVAVYFALNSPDKLRSEEYQMRHDILTYCERSQASPERTVSMLTTNPRLEDR